MFLLCCYLVIGFLDAPVTYEPSGIYERHVSRLTAAVNPHGDVYILNRIEDLVYRFTPDGKRAGVVGGKGQGPGEYTRPEQVFTDGDRLFIIDQGKRILCYHRDGTYRALMSAPIGMMLERVKDNWIYGNWRYSPDKKAPITLYFGDDELLTEKELTSWPRTGGQVEEVFMRKPGEPVKIPFNPVADLPKMTSTFARDVAYVYQPGSRLRIHVIDLAAQKRSVVVDLPVKPVPFDSDWATGLMKEATQRQKQMGQSIVHVADFPEFFPPASLLCPTETGDLVIGRMVSGNAAMDYKVFDRTGKETKSAYSPMQAYRILAVHGQSAWISTIGDGDQAVVVRVPVSEIARVLGPKRSYHSE